MDREPRFALRALAGVTCLLGLLLSSGLRGQDQTAAPAARPSAPRMTVLLDPAHGGTDPGADLGNKVAEKDVTLAFALKLRNALTSEGFGVVLTRDSGASDAVPADQRAATANRSHSLACISLHATRSGSGVHVYTSALPPAGDTSDATLLPVPWEMAQEQFVNQSSQLAAGLKAALEPAGLPVTLGAATVPPLDSMMCPAIAVEFAPLNTLDASGKGAEDAQYQASAVRAITAALLKWRAGASAPQLPQKAIP